MVKYLSFLCWNTSSCFNFANACALKCFEGLSLRFSRHAKRFTKKTQRLGLSIAFFFCFCYFESDRNLDRAVGLNFARRQNSDREIGLRIALLAVFRWFYKLFLCATTKFRPNLSDRIRACYDKPPFLGLARGPNSPYTSDQTSRCEGSSGKG